MQFYSSKYTTNLLMLKSNVNSNFRVGRLDHFYQWHGTFVAKQLQVVRELRHKEVVTYSLANRGTTGASC